jgi:hypothetical protein
MRHIRMDDAGRMASTAAASEVFNVFIIGAAPPVLTASAVWQLYASSSEPARPKTGANFKISPRCNFQTRRDLNPLTASIPGNSRAKSPG